MSLYYHNIDATATLNRVEPDDTLIVTSSIHKGSLLLFCADIKNSYPFLINDSGVYFIKINDTGSVQLEDSKNMDSKVVNIFKLLSQKTDLFVAIPIRKDWKILNRLEGISNLFNQRLHYLKTFSQDQMFDSATITHCKNILLAFKALDIIYLGKRYDLKANKYRSTEISSFDSILSELINKKAPFDCYPFNALIRIKTYFLMNQLENDKKELKNKLDSIKVNGIGDIGFVILNSCIAESNKKPSEKIELQKIIGQMVSDPFYREYISTNNFNTLRLTAATDRLININGDEFEINEIIKTFNTEYIYIDFWASWCYPCISEMKALNASSLSKYPNLSYVFISVDEDIEKWRKASNKYVPYFLQKNSYLLNKNFLSDWAKNLKISEIPRYILLDKKGNLINAHAPSINGKEFQQLMNNLDEKH